MLEEIKLKYSRFHDAQICKIIFNDKYGNNDLNLILSCTSSQNDYNLDNIKISFIDVISFKFNFKKSMGLLTIFACFLKTENDIITVDFDCIYLDEDNLKENPNSEFIIKCKEISYEVLSSE
jgi:hypothetical protein